MHIGCSLFLSRFDLMYGATASEKFHILPPVALLHGMLDGQRDEILRDHAKVNLLILRTALPPSRTLSFWLPLLRFPIPGSSRFLPSISLAPSLRAIQFWVFRDCFDTLICNFWIQLVCDNKHHSSSSSRALKDELVDCQNWERVSPYLWKLKHPRHDETFLYRERVLRRRTSWSRT